MVDQQKLVLNSYSDILKFASNNSFYLDNCIVDIKENGVNKDFSLYTLYKIINKNNHSVFPYDQKFNKEIIFENSVVKRINFSNIHFIHDFTIYKCEIIEAKFKNNIFKQNLTISHSFLDNCKFENQEFKKEIEISECTISKSLSISTCNFLQDFTIFNSNFDNYSKLESFDIFNSKFQNNFNISNVKSTLPLSISNSAFNNKVSLTMINSKQDLLFFSNSFYNDLNISCCTFLNFYLEENKVETKWKFELNDIQLFTMSGYYITNNGKFIIKECKIGDLKILSSFNDGAIFFDRNSKGIKRISLRDCINNGIIDVEDTEIKKIDDRRTARILKDSASKSNNIIDALKYKAIEMKLYKREKTSLSTIILLWLNGISNKHGLSWLRGVLFTLIVAFIFFSLIMLWGLEFPIYKQFQYFNSKVLGDLWVKYLDVLNVLNFRDRLNGSTLNPLGETLFFVSKIAISYGMFQTVSAFRKYGKL